MKPTYFRIIFLLFSFAFTSAMNAQLSGTVKDNSNNDLLEYATVALYKAEANELVNGIVTNASGNFKFSDLKTDKYYLEISFLGYETRIIEDIQYSGKPLDLGDIVLKLGNELNEVVIEGETPQVINRIDRQVFDATTFENSRGGTGTDVLRNLPSVSIDGQGEISVRGTTGFVVLLNGNPIQGQASTLIAQLPANSIQKVEVITAPSAKYDPEGKGGIINILTKKGAADGSFAQVNLKGGLPSIEDYNNKEYAQRYGIDATYNIRKGNWNISLGANYQRNDLAGRREGDVFTIINDTLTRFPSDGERSFDEQNYSGRFSLDFTPDENNTFSLGFFGGKRSKDRTADIVYYDNRAIFPAEDVSAFIHFSITMKICELEKEILFWEAWIMNIFSAILPGLALPCSMNIHCWVAPQLIEISDSQMNLSFIRMNTIPMIIR